MPRRKSVPDPQVDNSEDDFDFAPNSDQGLQGSDEETFRKVHQPRMAATTANKKSGRRVVVACKIPNGLVLQLQRKEERHMDDARRGTVTETIYVKYGERYFVAGPAYPQGSPPKGYPRQPIVEGGYALTFGISADFWEQWAEQNAQAPYFKARNGAEHGMIFAYPDPEDVVAAAVEQENLRSGMEPVSLDVGPRGNLTDPRVPKPNNPALAKVAPDDRMDQRSENVA